VGTLPPPRFSQGNLSPSDVNFCYGSRHGLLWPILDVIFDLDLEYNNSEKAIVQRKEFLIRHQLGICDIVESCERKKIDASDSGMQNVKLRDLFTYLLTYKTIHTLIFTGGNSKNGPEYFFRRHLKHYQLQLKPVDNQTPRIHEFTLSDNSNIQCEKKINRRGNGSRTIKTVSLTAPSGSANRAIK
jgi:G:T/U-mismatch repair DNA glycosylase